MAKRKSKKPQEEDTSILLESSVSQSRRKINSHTSLAMMFIIIISTVGASLMGWFCVQQQHSLDQLSESFTTMHKKITNLKEMRDTQADTGLGVEERIFALEETKKQAQEKAEVALATSLKLKSSDHYSQLWALRDEVDTRLTEINQVALSVTILQAMFKNQSEEFMAVKESVAFGLSSSSALAENVAELTNTVASACSRVNEQVASVKALNAHLEEQASDLNELKESMNFYNVALHSKEMEINQDMAAIKELVEAKQTMQVQALEEMLSSVQITLDEQFSSSQTLRSSVMAHLQTFHTQLGKAPSWSMKLETNEEGSAAEEFIFTAAQNATEVQEELEDVEEKDEQQQDDEDEAEEETEEEEAMQEKQPLEQEVEGGSIEKKEEEETTPGEQEDKEITEQSEEQEDAGETAEEVIAEETEDSQVSDNTLEEEVSEEVVESFKTVEDESAELNSVVFMDGNEEDG